MTNTYNTFYLYRICVYSILSISLLWNAAALHAAEEASKSGIKWLVGPAKAPLKDTAEVNLPAGYKFANGDDTRRMMKAFGEPTSGRELGLIMPTNGGFSVFFEFSDIGYVKDDEKDKLDADKILKDIIKGNDYANEERKKSGNPPLKITGWEKPPTYNPTTHNLEWAIRAESEGEPILNYNTRILGRKGVMEVVLVCGPESLSTNMISFQNVLAAYSFTEGQKYAEYRQGDKIAKYGLAALVTGGAVAVAAKTGLLAGILLFFKKAWKLVVVGAIAVVAFFKRIVFGARDRNE